MSLRILFADDSMTAQNMGKKILSEAGYDVVAVSNGAAAVKKIAEQKPDIIILDVYMPGYSGLEVCEKVRGSIDTLKTPVLLTVGKMEPYKPEDANRVKADGVIIKPFEASDLLAIVKKFEERISSMPPPMVAQPVLAENRYEDEEVSEPVVDAPVERGKNRAGMQPLVEVPDHMASSAAFGDFLGSEPASAMNHFAVNTPNATFETSVIVPPPPIPAVEPEAAAPAVERTADTLVAAPVREEVSVPAEMVSEIVAAPVEAIPEPPAETVLEIASAASADEASRPQLIPTFKDPEPEPAPVSAGEHDHSFIPTSAPPVGDLEIPREPELQETAEETTRSTKAEHVEPGLMSTIGQQVGALSSRPEPAPIPPTAEVTAAAVAEVASFPVPVPLPVPAAELTDSDFEARVAAAMAAYNQTGDHAGAQAVASKTEQAVEEPAPVIATPEVHAEVEAPQAHAAAAPIPSFEYQPPVRASEPSGGPSVAVADDVTPLPEAPTPHVDASAVTAEVESALPEAASAVAAETGAEHHHTIAQAVHRVMERLKPELVEEIMKELRGKK